MQGCNCSAEGIKSDWFTPSAIRGLATNYTELVEFTIEAHPAGGYDLYMRFIGDGRRKTGAGIWPTVEKAKSIAEQRATQFLHRAVVYWSDSN